MGVFDGQRSGSGGVFGGNSAASVGVYVTAPKKPKKSSGIGGFFDNLGSDIKDLSGIPAGLKYLGESIGHDTKKLITRGDGEYRLDDIGGAIKDSYTDEGTYTGEYGRAIGSLFQGDLGEAKRRYGRAWKSIYDAPLAPMLDVATVVTGGGAIAGKVATKVAKTTGSERAMRIAGLQRVDQITPSTVRGVSGPAGRFAAATHKITDPTTGNILAELPVVRNPVIRGRKAITEAGLAKLPSTGPAALTYLSPTRRGARLGEAQVRRTARRDAANLDKAYTSAFSKLNKNEKDALVYIAQGFNTTDRADALLTARTQRIAERIAEHGGAEVGMKKGDAPKKAKAAANYEDLQTDIKVINRIKPLIENPTPALREAIEAQRATNAVVQSTFVRNLVREGKTPEEAQNLINERAQMPLRAVGLEPGDGEVPMILTHVEDAAKRDKRGQNLERGMTTRILDEERTTTGENFLNARYDRDASSILTTHRLMFAKEQTALRMERAIAKAIPYDRTKHAAGINNGTLRLVDKNDQIIKDMQYIDSSLDRVEKEIGDFGDAEFESIRDAYDAMQGLVLADGSPGMVLPTAHYNELVGQFSGGKNILSKITDGVGALTKPWRHIVLSLKGSFYVNNFVGNLLLGIVAYGPRYILDVAHESLPAVLRGDVSKQISSDVADMSRTTGAANVADASKAARFDVFSRVGEKVARQGAKLTEDNFRRAAFRLNLRTLEKNLKESMPGTTRHERIEAIFNDKAAVDQLAESTYGDLLDYSKLTPVEKELLLPAMPFWNFTRSMTGRTIRLTLDEPWKMRVLLYFGESGIEANEDALPGVDLPDYLKGLIMRDPTGETKRVMASYGMNPFTAPADLANQFLGLFGKGEGTQNPLASFNPIWKVPLESVINKDLFTDQEIRDANGDYPEGTLGRMLVQGKKNIPQIAMLERYRYPGKYPAIERDGSDVVAQYFGAPVGTLKPENIERVNEIVAAMEARDKAYRESQKEATKERARF